MQISHIQPTRKNTQQVHFAQHEQKAEKLLRPVPQLSEADKAVFGNLEKKAKAMTIDDLMESMGIAQ